MVDSSHCVHVSGHGPNGICPARQDQPLTATASNQKGLLYSQATPAWITPTELHRPHFGLSSATASRLISEPQRRLKAPAHSDHPNSRLSTADYRLSTRLPTRLPSPSLMATTPPSVTIILTQFTLLSTPGASGTMIIV